MAQRAFLQKDYKAFYDDVIRDAAHQYLAMVQLDVGRNQRLLGCLVGMSKTRHEQFVTLCIDVSRWCDNEIATTLIPIYSIAKRLWKRFTRDKLYAKLDKLKRQMSYFIHTHILLNSLQEAAHVVVDGYYNQYDALVTRSLAPELTDEEKEKRSRGPTRIPVDEDRLAKIQKRTHAAKDRAELSGLGRYDQPKTALSFKEAFDSAPDEINMGSLGQDTDLFPEPEKKKPKEPKQKKKKPKKSKG